MYWSDTPVLFKRVCADLVTLYFLLHQRSFSVFKACSACLWGWFKLSDASGKK